MLVIFIGTIVYPVVLESVNAKARRIPQVIVAVPAPHPLPNVTPTDTLPTKPKEAAFTRDLTVGSRGEDVKRLQEYLNAQGFTVAATGPGSPGHESELFGKGTAAALKKFQEAYPEILLKPFGLTEGTGYFGSATRDFVNS